MGDVWLCIEGYNEREKAEWERTRAVAYNVAKFGNSDPKKFPKSLQRFWPFEWDKKKGGSRVEEILRQHEAMKKLREQPNK